MTDQERWRRAIFDVPTRAAFQKMDESLARYGAAIDTKDNTLKLTKNDDQNWKASFTYTRPAPDRLVLDGEIDGHKEKMELQLGRSREAPAGEPRLPLDTGVSIQSIAACIVSRVLPSLRDSIVVPHLTQR